MMKRFVLDRRKNVFFIIVGESKKSRGLVNKRSIKISNFFYGILSRIIFGVGIKGNNFR